MEQEPEVTSTASQIVSASKPDTRSPTPVYIASTLLWLTTAALVIALTLRFTMRAVGVRDELPLPGFIYSLTAPLVQPFYRYFPSSARFDFHTAEAASLLAAGSVLAVSLVLYTLGLLLFTRRTSTRG